MKTRGENVDVIIVPKGYGPTLMRVVHVLEKAKEKHPVYASGKYQALGVIGEEYEEFRTAIEKETDERAEAECLDVIATCMRFLLKNHIPTE